MECWYLRELSRVSIWKSGPTWGGMIEKGNISKLMGTSLLTVKRKELQIQKGENKAEPCVVEMELEVVNL